MLENIKKIIEESGGDLSNIWLWYRGVSKLPKGIESSAFNYKTEYEDRMPSDFEPLFGRFKHVQIANILDYPFKVRREYEGMSNWGYGVYFSNDLDWALRYGDNVIASWIFPDNIAFMDSDDFAYAIPNTLGGKINQWFKDNKMGGNMREQAGYFFRLIRKFAGKNKQALFVNTSGDKIHGQLVVFKPDIILPKYLIQIER